MNSKLNPRWKRLLAPVVLGGLLTPLPGSVQAGGARSGEKAAALRSGIPGSSVRHGTPAFAFVNPYRYYYYPYPYRFSGYYAQPIVVISPAYYPYYFPSTIVSSSPFYCLAHHAGWASRAGMLDHLSGTHKIPLETAASVCPDAPEGCAVEGY